MKVQTINNNCQLNFGKMIMRPKAEKLAAERFNQYQLAQIEIWKNDMKDFKNFDFEIDTIRDKFFLFRLWDKTEKKKYRSCELPLEPLTYKKGEKSLEVSGAGLQDYYDYESYRLEFPTAEEAEKTHKLLSGYKLLNEGGFCKLHKDEGSFSIFRWAVDSVKNIEKFIKA